jgi:hypothetical protein
MVEMVKFVEQWMLITVDNIKPIYYISNYGRIFSIYSNSFITPQQTENGYLQVGLTTNSGSRIYRKVHRLVMLTFNWVPNNTELQVNHKDCNKHHNWLWNLEWCTAKENIEHAIQHNLRNSVGDNNINAKLNESDVLKIYDLMINGYNDDQISSIIGCEKQLIPNIGNGRTWSYLFTNDQLNAMKRTRVGSFISTEQKHSICKFYEDNILSYNCYYNRAKLITEAALLNAGIEISDKSIRIARRLFFRLQNNDITNQYRY